jgi:hypothetical protein
MQLKVGGTFEGKDISCPPSYHSELSLRVTDGMAPLLPFAVNFTLSNMQPEPVGPAWQGAESPFYLPVYYVHGVYIQSVDGAVQEGDDNTEGNRKSFTAYWVRTEGAPDNFTFSP